MLLSRLWFLLLAVSAGVAVAILMMATSAFNREVDRNLEDQLRRDRYELELVMKSDARTRIDAIAGIAANGDVVRVLGQNNPDSEAKAALNAKLQELNSQLRGFAGDIVFAVDREGTIIGSLGVDPVPEGSGIGAFPLVERALSGFVRDDVWVWNDSVFRMAARPVVSQGTYVGAIVHGMEIDSDFAQQLSRPLAGATLAFFHDERVIGNHMPSDGGAARAEDIAGQLEVALANEELQDGGRTEPLEVSSARAVYSLITGSAASAGVGYAIARPYEGLSGIGDLFGQMDFERDLGFGGVGVLLGVVLLGFLLAMLFVFLEHDRPLSSFLRTAEGVGSGKTDRFDLSKLGGRYRKLAEQINAGLERALAAGGAAGGPRKPADLNEILGPSPDSGAGGPSFFGFADHGGADDIPAVPPAPGGQPAPRPTEPIASTAPLMPALERPAPNAPKASNGSPPPPRRASGPPPAPPSSSRGGAPPPPPPPGNKPSWAKGTLVGVGEGSQADTPSQRPVGQSSESFESMSPPAALSPEAPSDLPPLGGDTEDEEGQTIVASVPQELLDQVSSTKASEEEAHFHEVFQQFVKTKEQCGESTTSLTFERFKHTLRKNRDAILSKHTAKGVRFTVYVKEGKAALKATPIK